MRKWILLSCQLSRYEAMLRSITPWESELGRSQGLPFHYKTRNSEFYRLMSIKWKKCFCPRISNLFWKKVVCPCFTRRGEEDCSQVVSVGDLENFTRDVYQPAGHWRDPPEVQDPITNIDEIQQQKEVISSESVRKRFYSSHSSCLCKCNVTHWRWC